MKCARTDSAKVVENPHAVGVDVVVRRREDRPHADRLTAAVVSGKPSHGKRAKKEQVNCDHNDGLVSVSQGEKADARAFGLELPAQPDPGVRDETDLVITRGDVAQP